MITLLLKTKRNYFNGCYSSFVTGGEREREEDTGSGRTQAENSEYEIGYCYDRR